ncbi:MAG: hypothetical protein NTW03_22195 [Verrucomicrobia bacterium]|nr:hypothetical protein [Verrucomicrobiota bacterium]
MFADSETSPNPAPRKWDAEIATARRHPAWLAFETDIHQSPALRARVARALDRYGLGTSDVAVDDALDYLTHKELGQSARYFNRAAKAQFNQQQISHAVLSFMAVKEQQRHLTDCPIDDTDHDEETGDTTRADRLPAPGHLTPDEYAARHDALRAIHAMIPEKDLELYDLWLAIREHGQRGEPGTLLRLRAYAHRQGIALSTVYFRMKQLANTIQQHPWFDEITSPFLPRRRAA